MRVLAWTCWVLICCALAPVDAAKVGGKLSPGGDEIHIDLPEKYHRRNISSRGSGCCVFRSCSFSGHWQNLPQLWDFPEWLVSKGLPGGGSPVNVPPRVKAISAERGMPEPAYIQIYGAVEDDLKLLSLATQTGRLPAVTYGISPTPGRYRGRIAHMVSLPHADVDKGVFCVLDNNHIGVANYEWMDKAEFVRAYTSGGRSGWSVIFLDPGPPPVPWN